MSPEERRLWRQVAETLTPLPGRELAPVEEKPVSRSSSANHTDTPPAMQTARSALRQPASVPPLEPLERRARQKLVRGTAAIDARTDLHGLTQDQAFDRLKRFLATAQLLEHRLVLVITGKGHSDGEGVLKRMVPMWLARPDFRSLIVGYEEAHAGHGGSGALYIRIRKARKRSGR